MPLPSDATKKCKTSSRRDRAGAGTAYCGDAARPPATLALPRAIPLAVLTLAAFLFLAPAVRATTYKWIDDQGNVHYTDKIPPEAVNKGSSELNKQGVLVKKNDPALSPEQRRAREAEEERTRQAAKIRDEIQRKDRALMQTYTTEGEIDLSKRRALSTIEGQIQSAQGYIVSLNKRKQEISARVSALGNGPQPQSLERELTNVNEELERQADLITAKRKEIVVVTARYDADRQRWRELRAIAEAEPAGTTSAGRAMTTGGNIGAIPAAKTK